MASKAVNNYIGKRYDRWHDYAVYHCTQSGMKDEATDVLNEALCSLLQKDSKKLDVLLAAKKNGYTELDFFVLKMIKLNATSDTSPYRSRYKPIPADDNVEYSRLDIIEEQQDQEDHPTEILEKMHRVRDIIDELDLSPFARKVFEFRFFENENFSEWEGKENLKELYEVYNGVERLIKLKLSGGCLF